MLLETVSAEGLSPDRDTQALERVRALAKNEEDLNVRFEKESPEGRVLLRWLCLLDR